MTHQCNKTASRRITTHKRLTPLLTKQEGIYKILKRAEQTVVESVEVASGFRQKNVPTCCFAQSEYAGSSPGESSSTNTQHCGVKLACLPLSAPPQCFMGTFVRSLLFCVSSPLWIRAFSSQPHLPFPASVGLEIACRCETVAVDFLSLASEAAPHSQRVCRPHPSIPPPSLATTTCSTMRRPRGNKPTKHV